MMNEANIKLSFLIKWLAMAVVSVSIALYGEVSHNTDMIGVGVLMSVFVAGIIAGVIWATRDNQPTQEKAKRSSEDKLALLMDLMDDEERQAFKETLKRQYANPDFSNDGEIPYGLYEDDVYRESSQ